MAAKLGSGKRFAKLESSLAAKGVKNPAAVAATIGREKLGTKKMTVLAEHGKKRAAALSEVQAYRGAKK